MLNQLMQNPVQV